MTMHAIAAPAARFAWSTARQPRGVCRTDASTTASTTQWAWSTTPCMRS